MTTIELQARKALLIQEILNLNTETAIASLEKYIHKLSKSAECPDLCCYTHEEKINRLNSAEAEFEKGIYTSHDEVKNRIEKLKLSWKH